MRSASGASMLQNYYFLFEAIPALHYIFLLLEKSNKKDVVLIWAKKMGLLWGFRNSLGTLH